VQIYTLNASIDLYLFTHVSAIFVTALKHGVCKNMVCKNMAKITGSVLEYSDERITALMLEYERYIVSCAYIRMSEVFEYIVNQPCRRFWVSEIRAAVVIADMLKGDKLTKMHSAKREMFQEIYNRVIRLRSKNPGMSLYQLVSIVIQQPAPKFYLSPSSAKIMFYKARKKWYKKKKRKLHH